MQSAPVRPVPSCSPQPITADQFAAFTPEKLELISGYLIAPDAQDERRDLLILLLTNMGLEEAVRP